MSDPKQTLARDGQQCREYSRCPCSTETGKAPCVFRPPSDHQVGIEVATCCCRSLSAGCSSPFSSHPFVRKRPQRRGSDWSRLFIGRARGNSNTRSLVPSVAVSFRSNPRSASLGTGCWIGECPGTISDRSPCHRWSAPYVQSFDVVGSRSKRSNRASNDEDDARRQKRPARS